MVLVIRLVQYSYGHQSVSDIFVIVSS